MVLVVWYFFIIGVLAHLLGVYVLIRYRKVSKQS